MFTNYYEIAAPLTQESLLELSKLTTNSLDREKLELIANVIIHLLNKEAE
jgi:hypothetical protein